MSNTNPEKYYVECDGLTFTVLAKHPKQAMRKWLFRRLAQGQFRQALPCSVFVHRGLRGSAVEVHFDTIVASLPVDLAEVFMSEIYLYHDRAAVEHFSQVLKNA